MSISMPTIVGGKRVEEVLNLPLSHDGLAVFQASASTLRHRCLEVKEPQPAVA